MTAKKLFLVEDSIPVIKDGPMGTELERNGLVFQDFIWSAQALRQSPGKVEIIHKNYLDAGADTLTTNTFRTTPYAFH